MRIVIDEPRGGRERLPEDDLGNIVLKLLHIDLRLEVLSELEGLIDQQKIGLL